MKTCPKCKRSYADETLSFCLEDGSILTSSHDPHETLQLPATRSTEPAREEPVLPPTIQSPHAAPPPLYTGRRPSTPPVNEKQSAKPWMMLSLALALVSIVAIIVLLSVLWSDKESTADTRRDGNISNTYIPNANVSNTNTNTNGNTTNTNMANANTSNGNTTNGNTTNANAMNANTTNTNAANANTANANTMNANVTPSPMQTPVPTPRKPSWGMRQEASINEGDRITYYPTTTVDKCQADCDATPRCMAFTYIKAGAYNAGDPPMCYLMAGVKTVNPSPCCITAIKR